MRRLFLVFLVLIVAGLAAAYLAYRRDISDAYDRVAGRSQAVETSFGSLEYAVAGDGETLLAIHGSGGGFDQGLDFVARLARSGYRVIAPSRFGYLGSDMPANATPAMQADAFAEFLDQMGISEPIAVFGGSAGALSAIEFAVRHPDRCEALVLAVPAAYAPTRAPNTSGAEGMEWLMRAMLRSDFVFWTMLRVFPGAMTRILLATDPAEVAAASPSEQERVRLIRDRIMPVSARVEGLMMDMRTAGAPEPMELGRITCPVLTLSVRDDMFGTTDPAEYIAAEVADGRAVIYQSGGHVWVGHDEELWREIASFLESVRGGDANTPEP